MRYHVLLVLAGLYSVSMLLTACSQSAPDSAQRASAPAQGLRADCSIADSPALANGVCVRMFDTPARDSEASIATHPTDPNTVIVSWQATTTVTCQTSTGHFCKGSRIFFAVTTDAGRNWTRGQLDQPRLNPDNPLPNSRDDVDSTVSVGPDGTLYAASLWSGQDAATPPERAFYAATRTIVGASRDQGRTWAYSTVGQSSDLAPDYPDLAVAPDTGHLYVVAQQAAHPVQPLGPVFENCLTPLVCPPPEKITIWKSTDGGATWTEPAVGQSFFATQNFFPRAPRIVAGRDGFVAVTVKASPYDASAAEETEGYVLLSRDGGETWAAPARIHAMAPDFLAKPLGLSEREDGTPRLDAVYPYYTEIVGYRDTGNGWSGPHNLFTLPQNSTSTWLAAGAGPRGEIYAQYRYGAADRFAAGVSRWDQDGSVAHLTLVDIPGEPGGFEPGDDYGALAVAADGSAWMAWSDPRGAKAEAIAVARVLPAP